jgi:hypothetical protein
MGSSESKTGARSRRYCQAYSREMGAGSSSGRHRSGREGERGDDQWSGDPWSHARKRVLGIGNWWEAKAAAMKAADAERESGPRSEENGAVSGFGLPEQQQIEALEFGEMNIDMLDDTWMNDLLGGYDFSLEPYF